MTTRLLATLALVGLTSGCRMCSDACDYSPPVLEGPYAYCHASDCSECGTMAAMHTAAAQPGVEDLNLAEPPQPVAEQPSVVVVTPQIDDPDAIVEPSAADPSPPLSGDAPVEEVPSATAPDQPAAETLDESEAIR